MSLRPKGRLAEKEAEEIKYTVPGKSARRA